MKDFNERFVEAFKQAGLSVRDEETGKDLNQAEYLNQHTLYEIEGTWYTRGSVFSFGNWMNLLKVSFREILWLPKRLLSICSMIVRSAAYALSGLKGSMVFSPWRKEQAIRAESGPAKIIRSYMMT